MRSAVHLGCPSPTAHDCPGASNSSEKTSCDVGGREGNGGGEGNFGTCSVGQARSSGRQARVRPAWGCPEAHLQAAQRGRIHAALLVGPRAQLRGAGVAGGGRIYEVGCHARASSGGGGRQLRGAAPRHCRCGCIRVNSKDCGQEEPGDACSGGRGTERGRRGGVGSRHLQWRRRPRQPAWDRHGVKTRQCTP